METQIKLILVPIIKNDLSQQELDEATDAIIKLKGKK